MLMDNWKGESIKRCLICDIRLISTDRIFAAKWKCNRCSGRFSHILCEHCISSIASHGLSRCKLCSKPMSTCELTSITKIKNEI